MKKGKMAIIIILVSILCFSITSYVFVLSTNQSTAEYPVARYKMTLRPVANHNMTGCSEGALYNWWFPMKGPENWMDVDDTVPDGKETCLVINSSTHFDYFQLSDGLEKINRIESITLHAIISTDVSGVNDFSMEIFKNKWGWGTLNKMVTALYPEWEDYSYTFDVNPWTEQQWKVDDIKDMEVQIYVGDITSNVYCTQVYVDVDCGAFASFQLKIPTK